jgi:transglutaminase-like putative cysteine protease
MATHSRHVLTTLAVLLVVVLAAPRALAGPPSPATDEAIRLMLEAAGEAADYQNAALLYVLDEADVIVESSGLATTESCQVIKILTAAGIRSQSILRHEYDPDTNRVAIRSVRIHRAGGGIEEVSLAGLVTQPTKQSMIYWGGEQILLSIPRLQIGDALEIRTSKVGFNIAYLASDGAPLDATGLQPPMDGHWYEVTEFQGSHPILHKRYSVHLPADLPIQYEVYNGALASSLWFDSDRHVYTFTADDVPAVQGEPRMVARSDCVPKLVMATVPDWEMKSRWFHVVNEGQFEADDAIRAKVAEITAGLDDEEAKIEACLHWVADNIRYYGTSRGPCEGFTLHTGIETFRDKGGVCKDIASMLVTMLRVLGHETYPALTMAGSRVEAIPADQFNHTVTVMRYPDGRFRVLDPTWSPTSKEIWSSREALQGLVYGTPEGQSLTLSPYFSPEENMYQVRASSVIGAGGRLTSNMDMNMTGYPCTSLRRNVNRVPRHERWGRLEAALNLAPNASLDELEVIEPLDYSSDSWARMSVSADRYAAGKDGVRLFKLPMMRHPLKGMLIPDLWYDFSAKEREYGMSMRASRMVRYEETVALPEGWTVEECPESRTFESPSATLDFEVTLGDGELTYTFEIRLKDRIIEPANYPGVKKALEMMYEITDAWIVCSTD